ncbi:hypothetical protein NLX83_37175 [Allokutzneria sp. A3M-2-11 16]|nr:hypothetical protein [Allokutzneria sp. A3M-2-11 16]
MSSTLAPPRIARMGVSAVVTRVRPRRRARSARTAAVVAQPVVPTVTRPGGTRAATRSARKSRDT